MQNSDLFATASDDSTSPSRDPQSPHTASSQFIVEKRVPSTRILTYFTAQKWKKNGKGPTQVKFEYMRVRLYRSIKRTLRFFYDKQSFALGGVANISTPHSKELVIEMKSLCEQNKEELRTFAHKENGPNIDHIKSKTSEFNTYNNKYVRTVLLSPAIRKLYELYVEMIFEESDIERLCGNWRMNCCGLHEHTDECRKKWDRLKSILSQETVIYANNENVYKSTAAEGAPSSRSAAMEVDSEETASEI